jgi:hypothetical protein
MPVEPLFAPMSDLSCYEEARREDVAAASKTRIDNNPTGMQLFRHVPG